MTETAFLYRLIDSSHPLDWRMDVATPPTSLALITFNEPVQLKSSHGIKVTKKKRNDDRWVMLFELSSSEGKDAFSSFCSHVVTSSRNIAPENDAVFVAQQYVQWVETFKPRRGGLLKNAIQGLFGEIITLEKIIIPRYGEIAALESWMNSAKNKQDFLCRDIWYETKTIVEGKDIIRISSLDQLDRDDDGHMVVVTIRDSNPNSTSSMSLGMLYDTFLEKLDSPWAKILFIDTMHDAGYVHEVHDDTYFFEFVNISEYGVHNDFPRLRRSEIGKHGIADAQYDIYLDQIKNYEVK